MEDRAGIVLTAELPPVVNLDARLTGIFIYRDPPVVNLDARLTGIFIYRGNIFTHGHIEGERES